MKKIGLMLCVFIFFLTGCTVEAPYTTEASDTTDDADFGFSYEIMSDSVERGGRVGISVELINRQNVSYVWEGAYSDFRAAVILVCVNSNKNYTIYPEPAADTDDIGKHEVAAGEKRSFDYYFNIPADAELGSYSLVCSFYGTEKEFKNVLTIVS